MCRAEQAVTRIAKTGYDVFSFVQFVVNRCSVNANIGMLSFDERNAFRAGHNAYNDNVFGAVLFLTELFLALGKSGYLGPVLAAWLTNAIFLVLGGLFLYLRARNRTLSLPRLRAMRV